MTKRELIVKVAAKTGMTQRNIALVLNYILSAIEDELALGGSVTFPDFGTFELRVAKKTIGRNPLKPKDTYFIPEHVMPKFRCGKEFKRRVRDIDPNFVKKNK